MRQSGTPLLTVIRLLAVFWFPSAGVVAQVANDYEQPPISYHDRTPSDRVHRLNEQLSSGDVALDWSVEHGYLPSLLERLSIQEASQTLVFSKTSLQRDRISPARPRALYFNDDVYVGWVQGGRVIELAAVDPVLGATFYTLKQRSTPTPIIERDRHGECLACHATSRTANVPGFLVRSVFVEPSGLPDLSLGSVTTDHRTSFSKRYGGWYVTGSHGEMQHRGNALLRDGKLDTEGCSNRDDLPTILQAAAYLAKTSDIVALMVLEHQSQMHNWITRAGYTARRAEHQRAEMNRILDRPTDYQSESYQRRIRNAAEDLVEYLFFCDEFQLSSPVRGSQAFQEAFQQLAIRDRQGRSLRDLDLKTRLLRYPCSYLIYSPAFQQLPTPLVTEVKRQMEDVFNGREQSANYQHLDATNRRAILEILQETHPLFGPDR